MDPLYFLDRHCLHVFLSDGHVCLPGLRLVYVSIFSPCSIAYFFALNFLYFVAVVAISCYCIFKQDSLMEL